MGGYIGNLLSMSALVQRFIWVCIKHVSVCAAQVHKGFPSPLVSCMSDHVGNWVICALKKICEWECLCTVWKNAYVFVSFCVVIIWPSACLRHDWFLISCLEMLQRHCWSNLLTHILLYNDYWKISELSNLSPCVYFKVWELCTHLWGCVWVY